MAKKAGSFLHPNMHRSPAGSRLPALLIAQGFCLVLAVLGYRSDPAQGPPVRQEKGVTDAALPRRDERYESEEVGGKLALGEGAQGASSWMGPKEEEGDPKGKHITVSSCLLSKPLRYFRNMPDTEWSRPGTKEPSLDV